MALGYTIISVVICTKNRYDSLIRLIRSIESQKYPKCKIVIVDASDSFQNILEANDFSLEIVQIKSGISNLPKQRWDGLQLVDTEYVFFFDDDVTIGPNYFKGLLKIIEAAGENVVGGAGNIEYHPPLQIPSRVVWKKRIAGAYSELNKGNISPGGIPFSIIGDIETDLMVDNLRGPAMCYKTKVLKKFGHLPWLYELYDRGIGRAEDVALSSSLSKLGYRYIITKSVKCTHHTFNAGSPFSKSGYKKGMADTLGRYMVANNSRTQWNLLAKWAFFRYMFISFILLNKDILKDSAYRNGIWNGLMAIRRLKNDK